MLFNVIGTFIHAFGIGFGVKLAVGDTPILIKLPACGCGAVHGLVVITEGKKTLLYVVLFRFTEFPHEVTL